VVVGEVVAGYSNIIGVGLLCCGICTGNKKYNWDDRK